LLENRPGLVDHFKV